MGGHVCGIFGFFRMGELTVPSQDAFDPSVHLTFKDIVVDSMTDTRLLSITLKQSKTNQFKRGAQVLIGCSGDTMVCPVTATLAYLALRQGGEGPLFLFKNGMYLTKENFIKPIREALDTLGYGSEPSATHSFQIGAAIAAAEAGIDEASIKALGRWKRNAFQAYICLPKERLAGIAKALANVQQ